MEYKILAADDEIELLDALELYLSKENITLIKAKDGLEAMNLFYSEEVHLLLLDIMMPKIDGFSVLRRIREKSKVPAIMITARGEDYDKILGLELGADDYISKPFNPLEVVARIKAQLRRNYDYNEYSNKKEILNLFDLELNMEEGTLKKSNILIPLTSTEIKILYLLMKSPGRIFTKGQIFENVWEDAFVGDDNTIMVHISNLRNKIEADPKHPKILKTIKGLGYKLEKDNKV